MRFMVINAFVTVLVTVLTAGLVAPRIAQATLAAALYGEALYLQPSGGQQRAGIAGLIHGQTGEDRGYAFVLNAAGGAERARIYTLVNGQTGIAIRDSNNRPRLHLGVYDNGSPFLSMEDAGGTITYLLVDGNVVLPRPRVAPPPPDRAAAPDE